MKTKFLLLLFTFFLWSCDPNDDNSGSSVTDDQFSENFGPSVSRDFIGQIVNVDNQAIAGATVTIGSNSVQTDVNGVFVINGAAVQEKFAYVKATKAGYLDGSRSLVPTSGKNNVKIMLIPAAPIATISSGATADIDLPNGTKVTFDGAFEDENGNAYSGNVSVSMFHLETSDENISSLMPGMLYAKGEDGEAKVLQTFGMLNVELSGTAGQKLNIADGHTAEVSMKIDDSQTTTAPNSIPLWHFDEAVGYWKQDGEATKQGNFYVGEVSHFSWWNCDLFASPINLQVVVTDANGTPSMFAAVGLIAGTLQSSYGLTDQNGQINGPIPINQMITVVIYDVCGNLVFNQTVGPFSSDTTLPITLTQPGSLNRRVVGTLINCANEPVTNGYALIDVDGKYVFSQVSNGSFDFNFMSCSNIDNFTFIGVDYDNSQQTGVISYSFINPRTDIGSVPACSGVDEFISFKVGDSPVTTLTENITNNSTWNSIGPPMAFLVSSNTPFGTVPSVEISIPEIPGNAANFHFYYSNGSQMNQYETSSPNSITVNKFGPPGDFVDFIIHLPSQNGAPPAIGVAHVRRN